MKFFHDKVKDIATKYSDGFNDVLERREFWKPFLTAVKEVWENAAKVFQLNNMKVYIGTNPWHGKGQIQFVLDSKSTQLFWRDTNGEHYQLEIGGAIGYSQCDDGRVVFWIAPHHMSDEEGVSINQFVFDPRTVAQVEIEKHLIDGFTKLFPTSFRGWNTYSQEETVGKIKGFVTQE